MNSTTNNTDLTDEQFDAALQTALDSSFHMNDELEALFAERRRRDEIRRAEVAKLEADWNAEIDALIAADEAADELADVRVSTSGWAMLLENYVGFINALEADCELEVVAEYKTRVHVRISPAGASTLAETVGADLEDGEIDDIAERSLFNYDGSERGLGLALRAARLTARGIVNAFGAVAE